MWWSEDGVTWTEVENNSERFSPRRGHQAVSYDNRLWVIGGWDGGFTNDVWWSEDGVVWTELNRFGSRFSARDGHQVAVHDGKLWVIGGFDGALKSDVWWSADGSSWTQATSAITTETNYTLIGHQVVSFNNRLWIIGGGEHGNQLWSSEDGANWVLSTSGNIAFHVALGARNNHQAVVHNNRLWVIGGRDGGNFENDVWWTENGTDWTLAKASPQDFPSREQHGFVSYNNRLWVIGGSNVLSTGLKNDVWWSEDGANWRLGFSDVFQFQ